MRRTKIVATIGSMHAGDPQMLERLIAHGVDVARFNFSHGTHVEHERAIAAVRDAAKKTDRIVAIFGDIRGPKIRTGTFSGGLAMLAEGEKVTLTTREIVGDAKTIPIDYPKFMGLINKGNPVYLCDGMVELKVHEVEGQNAECVVAIGGEVGNRKGVNVPHTLLDLPAISKKDEADVEFLVRQKADFIAQSYVRSAADVAQLRSLLAKLESDAHIIAKVEDAQGYHNLKEIIEAADGVMVARGDLGVQLPMEDIPGIQKEMVRLCRHAAKPVIIATQMLESMIHNPAPTRAEVSDVANGVVDGADALMLSGETAVGRHPLRAVETMDRIIRKTEGTLVTYNTMSENDNGEKKISVPQSISKSVCYTARDLRANAIITYTSQGHTARYIAMYRPFTPILAATANVRELPKLQLLWGVHPVHVALPKTTDDIVVKAVDAAEKKALVGKGDLVVITAGIPVNVPGHTNMMKAHVV